MAWGWSHTQEAYANAREQLEHQERDWLRMVYAEWEAKSDEGRCAGGFSQYKYKRALGRSKKMPNDVLADYIWDKMSEQAICENGGFMAWACPWGCHLVSFDQWEDPKEKSREEAADKEWGELELEDMIVRG